MSSFFTFWIEYDATPARWERLNLEKSFEFLLTALYWKLGLWEYGPLGKPTKINDATLARWKKLNVHGKPKKDKHFYPQGNARGDDHAELFHNQQQVRNGEVQVLKIKAWILSLERKKLFFRFRSKLPVVSNLTAMNMCVNIFPNPHCHCL